MNDEQMSFIFGCVGNKCLSCISSLFHPIADRIHIFFPLLLRKTWQRTDRRSTAQECSRHTPLTLNQASLMASRPTVSTKRQKNCFLFFKLALSSNAHAPKQLICYIVTYLYLCTTDETISLYTLRFFHCVMLSVVGKVWLLSNITDKDPMDRKIAVVYFA